MRKRRQSVAVLASAALLSASLSAVADCASLCAPAPAVAPHAESAAMHCGRCAQTQSAHQQSHPNPSRQQPYNPNCGQHCLSQAMAGKASLATAKTAQQAARELLAVNNCVAPERLALKLAPLTPEAHSPPVRSGRSICRSSSLLRI